MSKKRYRTVSKTFHGPSSVVIHTILPWIALKENLDYKLYDTGSIRTSDGSFISVWIKMRKEM